MDEEAEEEDGEEEDEEESEEEDEDSGEGADEEAGEEEDEEEGEEDPGVILTEDLFPKPRSSYTHNCGQTETISIW